MSTTLAGGTVIEKRVKPRMSRNMIAASRSTPCPACQFLFGVGDVIRHSAGQKTADLAVGCLLAHGCDECTFGTPAGDGKHGVTTRMAKILSNSAPIRM